MEKKYTVLSCFRKTGLALLLCLAVAQTVWGQAESKNPNISGGVFWKTTGNTGTDASVNYIGTTDPIDWVVKTAGSERMRVSGNNGNVGIGTTNPFEKLHVQYGNILLENSWAYMGLTSMGNSAILARTLGNELHYGSQYSSMYDDVHIFASYTNAVSIDNANGSAMIFANGDNNNVGIGLTNPIEKLHVYLGNVLLENSWAYMGLTNMGNGVILARTLGNELHYGSMFSSMYDDVHIYASYTNGVSIDNANGGSMIYADGDNDNVGIGTVTPFEKLHVYLGNVLLENSWAYMGLTSMGNEAILARTMNNELHYGSQYSSFYDDIHLFASYSNGVSIDDANGTSMLYADGSNDYIGIGTTSPVRPLTIATGQLRFTNVLGDVEFEEAADFHTNVTTASPSATTPVMRVHSNSSLSNVLMYLQHNGNLGLGTSTPTLAKLQVQGGVSATVGVFSLTANSQGLSLISDWPGIYLNSYYNGGVRAMAASGYPSQINSDQSSGGLTFHTTTTANTTSGAFITVPERVRITGAGNVGIGTSVPSYQLELSTNSAAKPTSNTWTVTSDARLKTNVHDYTDGLSHVLKIRPVWFTYTGEAGLPKDTGIGALAQDIQAIAPYMVHSYTYTDTTSNKKTEYLSLDNGAMTYMLINAVKELNDLVRQQQKEIDELKKKKD